MNPENLIDRQPSLENYVKFANADLYKSSQDIKNQ